MSNQTERLAMSNRQIPPPPPPSLKEVGYEMEIRPYDGLWNRFEGRIIRLVQSGAENPNRIHHLPARQPYWERARTQERLRRRLRDALNEQQRKREQSELQSERMIHTMAGWQ